MIVKYVGRHTGGLQQIGTHAVSVTWNQPVDLPDELAEAMIAQAPDDWETVVKKSTTPKSAAAVEQPEEGDES
jgi:hypothetical protein